MEENKIVKKLLEHDDQFRNIRREINQLRQELLQGQDEMMVGLKGLESFEKSVASCLRAC